MLRLVKDTIKQIVFIPLFIFSSAAFSQSLTKTDALLLMNDDGEVVIPDIYDSLDVAAFKNTAVKKVIIPDTITVISDSAFENTYYLEEVLLPATITTIEKEAFYRSSIKSIHLPDSVTSIGRGAFAFSDLEEINFPESLQWFSNESFRNTQLQSISIPDNADVQNLAFMDIPLKILTVGRGVTFYKGVLYRSSGDIQYAYIDTSVWGQKYENSVGSDYDGNKTQTNNGLYIEFSGNLKTLVFGPNVTQIKNSSDYSYCNSALYGGSQTKVVFKSALASGSCPVKYGNVYVFPSTTGSSYFVSDTATVQLCHDVDSDNDGHQNCYDQLPNDPDRWFDYGETSDANAGVVDSSSSGLVHSDSDGLADIFDQYPTTNNVEGYGEGRDQSEYELDTDYDGINNYQDIDDDDDGLIDIYEPFYGTNPLIPDSDFDGTLDGLDAFPLDNTESLDTDSDGIGNNADTDDDNDGYTDFLDAFPTDATEWADSDLDGIGNNSDLDDDNDGVADTEDAFPHTASESLDSDNDGVGDNADAFPNDATEVADTDLDGIGNNADPDDDNDGVADADDGDPLNADIGIQPSQLISVTGNPVGVNGHSARISLSYDASDGNNQLPGIGFRLHYSSEMLSFAGTENTIANDIIVDGDGPYQDDSDLDNDLNTDKYIIFGWAALNGDWPNSSLPASLVDVVFNVSWEAFDQASITTPINFSKVSATEGYNFEATNYTLNVLPATWDFDGNGQADALTDGLILLRHAFGVRGASLTDSVMATDSTMTSEEVQVAVEKALVIADVDGDGNVDALTDGLIVLRYMFGLTGDTLMDGVVSANATRVSSESVQQHIELYMPNNLLPPVQSEQSFIVGDWKLAGVPERADNTGPNSVLGWSPRYDSLDEYCMEDDTYRFGMNGSFEYTIGTTYTTEDTSSPFDSSEGNCGTLTAPWDGSYEMSYTINEENNTLTLLGKGAFIGHAEVANLVDQIMDPYLAPDEVSYDFAKIDENSMQLIITGQFYVHRYTLIKVVN